MAVSLQAQPATDLGAAFAGVLQHLAAPQGLSLDDLLQVRFDRAELRQRLVECDAYGHDVDCARMTEVMLAAGAGVAGMTDLDAAGQLLHGPTIPTESLLWATAQTNRAVLTLHRRLRRASPAEIMDLLGFMIGGLLRSDEPAFLDWATGAAQLDDAGLAVARRQGRRKRGSPNMAAPRPTHVVNPDQLDRLLADDLVAKQRRGPGWDPASAAAVSAVGTGPFLVVDQQTGHVSTHQQAADLQRLFRPKGDDATPLSSASVVCLRTGRRVWLDRDARPEPVQVLASRGRGREVRVLAKQKKDLPLAAPAPAGSQARPGTSAAAAVWKIFKCTFVALALVTVVTAVVQEMKRPDREGRIDAGSLALAIVQVVKTAAGPVASAASSIGGIINKAAQAFIEEGCKTAESGFRLAQKAVTQVAPAAYQALGLSVPAGLAALFGLRVSHIEHTLPGQTSRFQMAHKFLVLVTTLGRVQPLLFTLFSVPLVALGLPAAYTAIASGLAVCATAVLSAYLSKQTIATVDIGGVHVSEKVNADPQALTTVLQAGALSQVTQGWRTDETSKVALEVYRSVDGALDLLDLAVQRLMAS